MGCAEPGVKPLLRLSTLGVLRSPVQNGLALGSQQPPSLPGDAILVRGTWIQARAGAYRQAPRGSHGLAFHRSRLPGLLRRTVGVGWGSSAPLPLGETSGDSRLPALRRRPIFFNVRGVLDAEFQTGRDLGESVGSMPSLGGEAPGAESISGPPARLPRSTWSFLPHRGRDEAIQPVPEFVIDEPRERAFII